MANIRKRGVGTYEIKVSCGYDISGKQKCQYMTWKATAGMTPKQIEKELQRAAVLFEESCKHGQITAVVKFEVFAEQYLEEHAKLNQRYNTFQQSLALRTRIYPALGYLKLDKVTTRHIQKFMNELFTNEKSFTTGKPLSRKTVLHHLNFISNVFNYAIRMGLIQDNPCSRVTIPKQESKEKAMYTIAEMERIFEKLEAEPLKYRLFIMLAVYSGCRRGELLGAEWKDINFEESLLHVKRTSNYSPKRGMYTDTTKTKKSQRILKFPKLIMDMLREHKENQDYERERTGDKWQDSDRLFVQWDGRPLHNNTPYTWFQRFCQRSGFRFCDLHSMRHFHASALINAGVDVVAVSSGLGHSNVNTTLGIYSHIFQEARVRNCDAIAGVLDFKKSGSNENSNGKEDCDDNIEKVAV